MKKTGTFAYIFLESSFKIKDVPARHFLKPAGAAREVNSYAKKTVDAAPGGSLQGRMP
jgi:hypothetical protein